MTIDHEYNENLFEAGIMPQSHKIKQISVTCNSKLMKIHETESVAKYSRFKMQVKKVEVHRKCRSRGV